MTTTDTNLQNLIINDLSQSDYESITPNANELYLTDEVIESSDIITALGYTPYNSTNPDGFLQNTATGRNSLTLLGNTSTRQGSINIGARSVSMGDWNVTLGEGSYGGVMEAVAIGHGANYSSNNPGGGNHSVAIGANAIAGGGYSTAIGYGATASDSGSLAIGRGARATGSGAIMLGQGANSTLGTFAVGLFGTTYTLLNVSGKIPNARLNTLVGADGTNAGTAGIVPAPTATDNTKFLKGDGTWADLTIPTVDQTYDATSTNAQSGVAIAGAGFVESSDLEEVQCVVETYQNGSSWYRVWSDGWCEQGGIINATADAAYTLTLLKPFANTNYQVFITRKTTGDYTSNINGRWGEVYNITTTTFTTWGKYSSYAEIFWQACGYIEV